MHAIAGKAVALKEALQPEFKTYQKNIIKNAAHLAETLSSRGYRVVSGGTDNHLMLIDLSGKDITGKEAETALEKAGITVNKNLIPYDTKSPFVTSGIRIGTPAVTTRGMKEAEMTKLSGFIDSAIMARNDEKELRFIREEIREFLKEFPLYENWANEMENSGDETI